MHDNLKLEKTTESQYNFAKIITFYLYDDGTFSNGVILVPYMYRDDNNYTIKDYYIRIISITMVQLPYNKYLSTYLIGNINTCENFTKKLHNMLRYLIT